ncbi:hypothetical protein FSC37_03015 [Piscinibacter aquaticus]|uniref:Poly-beta-hydroxybutyrate polymerase N-terminal domain-containing protein n=1 Tax=Piscinibacter aquaticus TaxID=392597 RepID=A0A5C6TYN3_9BURK|nr:hypothetical protein FSC37_03015 [Piscinibacter aquaticus]
MDHLGGDVHQQADEAEHPDGPRQPGWHGGVGVARVRQHAADSSKRGGAPVWPVLDQRLCRRPAPRCADGHAARRNPHRTPRPPAARGGFPTDRRAVAGLAVAGLGRLGLAPGRLTRAADGAGVAGDAAGHRCAAGQRRPGRCRRRGPALSPSRLGELAVQRDAQQLPQCRGLVARRRAAAGHDEPPCRTDRLHGPTVAGRDDAGELVAQQPGGAAGQRGKAGRAAAPGLAELAGRPATPATERAAAEREARFKVGRDVAVTPGEVVMRNGLAELIRYAPQTKTVHPEPVLIVPSWIMKYYILDLSPHNSLVRYPVSQGHVVYMLSWKNPEASDHDLTMDDYLRLGPFDALKAIAALEGRAPAHAMGYCLGGTLMAIAAAALAREGVVADRKRLAPLKTLTLLAAQTDFSEPGELGLFIDESRRLPAGTEPRPRLLPRRGDGRVVPVPALARPGLDAAHARIPDGRARAAERPDGLEQRLDPHAGAHAPRVPDLAVPAQRIGDGQLPRRRARGQDGLAGRPAPAGVPRRHHARPRLAVALGLQAAPPVRGGDHLRLGQRRAQRRHRVGAGPSAPQLPPRHAARPRAVGSAGRLGARRGRARGLLVAGLASLACRSFFTPACAATAGTRHFPRCRPGTYVLKCFSD